LDFTIRKYLQHGSEYKIQTKDIFGRRKNRVREKVIGGKSNSKKIAKNTAPCPSLGPEENSTIHLEIRFSQFISNPFPHFFLSLVVITCCKFFFEVIACYFFNDKC